MLVLHESLLDRILTVQFFFHVHLDEESKRVNLGAATHGHEIADYIFLPIEETEEANIKPAFLRTLIPKFFTANYDSPILHIRDC